MKKLLIVNNNMKIGGVQKSLYNLLWSISDCYDVTLYLFSDTGAYVHQLPDNVRILGCTSLFRYLGISQGECKQSAVDFLRRGLLAMACKILGRPRVIPLLERTQPTLQEEYDIAISYLHNGNVANFYGGVNEFVLHKVRAGVKIDWLHCDYGNCGANHPDNNRLYRQFERIVACSDGCRRAFLNIMPELGSRVYTVPNFHRVSHILEQALIQPVVYHSAAIHVVFVGRLAHEKAVDRAIKAIAHVRASDASVELHIVGDGACLEELRQLVQQLQCSKWVTFHGEQSNPYRYMLHADLLLMTSYHEAAPMVIDEARIIGLPVLSTETTSGTEMILEGDCGWVCDNTQEGINQDLMWLVTNPAIIHEKKTGLKQREHDHAGLLSRFQTAIEGETWI